jgi:hypothetical protein
MEKSRRVTKLVDSQETIRYVIKPHTVRPNMKVVTIYCDEELVATFYMHSSAGKRFGVFMSKHIVDAYIDRDNPLAIGVAINLGEVPPKSR